MDIECLSLIVNIILTIVTGVMAIATYKMACSTRKSVDEMEISRKESNSAEVVVYLYVEYNRIYLVIENVGKTVAKNIILNFDSSLKNTHNTDFSSLEKIAFLPPNYKIKTFFGMSHSIRNEFQGFPEYIFKVIFETIYDESVEREYISDLNFLNSVEYLTSESETLEMSLYKIRKELEKTNNSLEKIKSKK
ncbi:hypothetical protein SAMN02910297_00297 [Methanobrevibacter olleyae]|uniref:Uncharacterized protein n=1 Tax=Methanobrevibacter olleyae TaxID=294671 RepID=A0A1I4G2Y1_METOL|nr:hypothetical protein [Methanobrevibacter olleyae]SFL23381.1 hypothetical protein SAMN02910297_00297 [Methanobrevibacter olleyae]